MNGTPYPPSGTQTRSWQRSIGIRLIVVCGLILLMALPAFFVSNLLEDRQSRTAAVIKEISARVGGQQVLLGPTLAIPCEVPSQVPGSIPAPCIYFVFPVTANAHLKTATEDRHRSLFRVPVFRADVTMDSTFDLSGTPSAAPQGAILDWARAEVVIGVSDARGALADAQLIVDGKTSVFTPAASSQSLLLGPSQGTQTGLTLFGSAAIPHVAPGARFQVSAAMKFSGAQRIAVLAYGKATHLSIQGDWSNPGFDGGFLPARRDLSPSGFTAEWSVPYIARGVPAEGTTDAIAGLAATPLGVSFVEVADPYQSVSRSLKYVLLFLSLVFLTYFIVEITTGRHLHPAQYLLVGAAQLIFYLLLLSLSERIGFDLGFLIAGLSTVLLLSANVRWVFAAPRYGRRALAIFTLLYGLIYLLLRLEDNALLVGATASFLAVAAAMYYSREIDWYASGAAGRPIASPAP